MPVTINARIVLDVDCPRAAQTYWEHVTTLLPKENLLSAQGHIFPSTEMPLVTGRDLDNEMDRLVEMAKTINRHATIAEQRVVEARVNLARAFSSDLERLARSA